MPNNIVMENGVLLRRLIAEYQDHVNVDIPDRQIFDAIVIYCQDYKELDLAVTIYGSDLDYSELKNFLWKYDFSANLIVIESDAPASLVPKLFKTRALIKHNGIGWIVHKNDSDPFPSSPHAHNTENNLKLHLGTGGIYKKSTQLDKVTRKELLAIRNKLEPKLTKIGLSLPVLAI